MDFSKEAAHGSGSAFFIGSLMGGLLVAMLLLTFGGGYEKPMVVPIILGAGTFVIAAIDMALAATLGRLLVRALHRAGRESALAYALGSLALGMIVVLALFVLGKGEEIIEAGTTGLGFGANLAIASVYWWHAHRRDFLGAERARAAS